MGRQRIRSRSAVGCRWNIVMGWRQPVEIALAPVEQAGQEIPDDEVLKMLPASTAVDGRGERLRDIPAERHR